MIWLSKEDKEQILKNKKGKFSKMNCNNCKKEFTFLSCALPWRKYCSVPCSDEGKQKKR